MRVWNVSDRSLHTEASFNVDQIRSVMFIDDSHLLVVPRVEPVALVLTLDPAELADIGTARLTRGFTENECVTYSIEPCPTLEELRGG